MYNFSIDFSIFDFDIPEFLFSFIPLFIKNALIALYWLIASFGVYFFKIYATVITKITFSSKLWFSVPNLYVSACCSLPSTPNLTSSSSLLLSEGSTRELNSNADIWSTSLNLCLKYKITSLTFILSPPCSTMSTRTSKTSGSMSVSWVRDLSLSCLLFVFSSNSVTTNTTVSATVWASKYSTESSTTKTSQPVSIATSLKVILLALSTLYIDMADE